MKLENSFTVPVAVEQAWQVLQDVERIAPCMPGATLDAVDGDSFTGRVKVKVGPIMLTYAGKATFADKDEAAHAMTIEASGKETRGSGTAKATVHASMQADGDSTKVLLVTELAVTGKPAQFGRGVMADVSGKLIDQFAKCLGEEVQSGSSSATPAAEEAAMVAQACGLETRLDADLGVAGLHRFMGPLAATLEWGADVIIVAAGMEGALPSVVAGLVDVPVVAVPTSVGYGASLAGVTALLAMLASCAAGLVVVGLDNGFGAACAVARILGPAGQ